MPPLILPGSALPAKPTSGTILPLSALAPARSGVDTQKVVQQVSSPLTFLSKAGEAAKKAFVYLQPQEAGSGIVPAGETPTGESVKEYAKKAGEAATTPLIPLEELVPESASFVRGAARAASTLSTPESLALVGGMGGAGKVASLAKPVVRATADVVNTALSTYFAAQAAEGLVGSAKEAYKAWEAGDTEKAKELLGEGTIQGIIAGTVGKHAWKKVKDIRPGIFVPLRTGPEAQVEAPRVTVGTKETVLRGKGTPENPEVLGKEVVPTASVEVVKATDRRPVGEAGGVGTPLAASLSTPAEVAIAGSVKVPEQQLVKPGREMVLPNEALAEPGAASIAAEPSTTVAPRIQAEVLPAQPGTNIVLYRDPQGVAVGSATLVGDQIREIKLAPGLKPVGADRAVIADLVQRGGRTAIAGTAEAQTLLQTAGFSPSQDSPELFVYTGEETPLTETEAAAVEGAPLAPASMELQETNFLTPSIREEGQLPDGLLPKAAAADPPEKPAVQVERLGARSDRGAPLPEVQPARPVPPPVESVTPSAQSQLQSVGTTEYGGKLMESPQIPGVRFEIQPDGTWFAYTSPTEEVGSGLDAASLEGFISEQLPEQSDRGDFPPEALEYAPVRAALQQADSSAAGGVPRVAALPEEPDPLQQAADAHILKLAAKGKKSGGKKPPSAGDPPPLENDDLERMQNDLTRFGAFSKRFLSLVQWAERNPHVEPLQRYLSLLAKGWEYKNSFTLPADDKIQLWDKLGKTRSDKLSRILLDTTIKSWKVKRRLTDEEEIEIGKKYKADELTMQVYRSVDLDFQIAHKQMRDALEEHAREILIEGPALEATLKQIEKDFGMLANRNYFPLSRFGQHVLVVKARQKQVYEGKVFRKGAVILSEQYEGTFGKLTRRNRYNKLKAEFGSKAYVRKDYLDDASYALNGFPPVLADMLERKLDLSEEQLARMRQLRYSLSPIGSFTRHAMSRKSIAGYSLDAQRAYATYFQHLAGAMFRIKYDTPLRQALQDLNKSASGIKEGNAALRRELASEVEKHYAFTMNPGNDLAVLRGWIFNYYFAFSPKQALVNLTQVPMFAYPHLAGLLQKAGYAPGVSDAMATQSLVRAMRDVGGMFQVDKPGRAARGAAAGAAIGAGIGAGIGPVGAVGGGLLGAVQGGLRGVSYKKTSARLSQKDNQFTLWATQRGLLNQSYATEVAGVAHGNMLTRLSPWLSVDKLARKLTQQGTLPFSVAEEYNRRVTALAAYRLATQRLKMTDEEAQEFAEKAIRTTMGEYSRWNRLPIARGWKSAAFIFKTFLQFSLYFGLTQPGRLRFWMMLAAVGGLSALIPDEVKSLISTVGTQALKTLNKEDPKLDLEQEMHEFFKDLGGDPEFYMHGLAHSSFGMNKLGMAVGLPIPAVDLSPSFKLGTVVPGLKGLTQLLDPKPDLNRILVKTGEDLLGVTGSTGMNMLKAVTSASPRSPELWGEKGLPAGLRNLIKGWRMSATGEIRDPRGKLLVKLDPMSVEDQIAALAQVMGMTPTELSNASEADFAVQQVVNYYTTWREVMLQQFAVATVSGDREAKAAAQKAYAEFQHMAPAPFRIVDASTLVSSIMREASAKALQAVGLPAQSRLIPIHKAIRDKFGVRQQQTNGPLVLPGNTLQSRPGAGE